MYKNWESSPSNLDFWLILKSQKLYKCWVCISACSLAIENEAAAPFGRGLHASVYHCFTPLLFVVLEVKFIESKISHFKMNNSVAFQYIYNVVQPPLLSSSKIFSLPPNKTPLSSSSSFPAPSSPWQVLICFLSLWIYLFWIFLRNGNILYLTFYIWYLSLKHDVFEIHSHSSRCQHFITFYGWMVFCRMDMSQFFIHPSQFFIRPSTDKHLECFHLLPISSDLGN